MELTVVLIFLLSVSRSLSFAEKIRYDNHKLYSIQLQNEDQMQIMQEIENNSDAVSF